MKTRIALLLTGLLLALPVVSAKSYRDKTITQPAPRVGEVTAKIVGGSAAQAGANRWIASLQYQGEHFCGGSLVSPTWVMTAAHCVSTESASGTAFSVWIGGHDLRNDGQGIRRDVAQIVVHPQYDDYTEANDIALLRLASAVPATIQPVTLATAQIMSGPAAPNQPVTVSGWGALSENGGSPDQLHEVVVPMVSNSTCNAPQSYGGEVSANQICAGLRSGGKDSCYGDSGGPLWLNFSGRDYHVGVVSWGEGCALPDKYGVYTRTASYGQWVTQIATDIGTGTGSDDGGNGDGSDGSDDGDDPLQCELADDPDTGPDLPGALLQSDQLVSNLSASRDGMLNYVIDVPAGARRLVIDIWGGSGDADLYVAFNRPSTTEDYDYSPFLVGNQERVVVNGPTAGRWTISIHAYEAFQRLSLRAIVRQ